MVSAGFGPHDWMKDQNKEAMRRTAGMYFSLMVAARKRGSINMPVTAGEDFQTAVIYRPVQLEISPRRYFRPARANPSR